MEHEVPSSPKLESEQGLHGASAAQALLQLRRELLSRRAPPGSTSVSTLTPPPREPSASGREAASSAATVRPSTYASTTLPWLFPLVHALLWRHMSAAGLAAGPLVYVLLFC